MHEYGTDHPTTGEPAVVLKRFVGVHRRRTKRKTRECRGGSHPCSPLPRATNRARMASPRCRNRGGIGGSADVHAPQHTSSDTAAMKTKKALTAPQPSPSQKPGGGCLERLVRWIRRQFCQHGCHLNELRRAPNGGVECPCIRCGKMVTAEYGLVMESDWRPNPPNAAGERLPAKTL